MRFTFYQRLLNFNISLCFVPFCLEATQLMALPLALVGHFLQVVFDDTGPRSRGLAADAKAAHGHEILSASCSGNVDPLEQMQNRSWIVGFRFRCRRARWQSRGRRDRQLLTRTNHRSVVPILPDSARGVAEQHAYRPTSCCECDGRWIPISEIVLHTLVPGCVCPGGSTVTCVGISVQ